MFSRITTYLSEVRSEMVNRVTWPSPEDLRGSTIVVMVVTGIFAAFIGVFDWALSLIVQWVL
ncbi:MAG: preprotein translocase subunit SecE [Candidatus Latescibacteria bacterium]|nr:preprotein translocase subunit SecE [Candidatus Latescibacterota bacterium]